MSLQEGVNNSSGHVTGVMAMVSKVKLVVCKVKVVLYKVKMVASMEMGIFTT